MKKVYYDATFSVRQYRGMGKYIRQIINVLKQSGPFEVTGMLAGNIKLEEEGLVSFGSGFYPIWEQQDLGKKIKADKPDYAIFPYNTMPLTRMDGVKKVLIVHDLIFLEPLSKLPLSGTLLQNAGRFYRRWNVPKAIRKADVIISVSEYSANEIRKIDAGKKIYVIPNAIDTRLFQGEVEREERKYIFHLGGSAPHKNSLAVLKAFEQLDKELYLYIAGVYEAKTQQKWLAEIKDPEVRSRVVFMEYLSDSDIVRLYKNAVAFIFPSLLEGFGIPIIEAMAAGSPVVLSNASVMPEIGADAALYFDPYKASELAEKIQLLLNTPALREELIQKGLKRAEDFNIQQQESKLKKFIEHEF
jgi:glycosyltransferase involved in cell wall biosynthesis